MLSSTKEYLQALRDGKYLLFLQWPKFIAEYYGKNDKNQEADEMVNLIIFEWLNNGFCEEDIKKFAILYAVHEMESRPLREGLSYALITISIALFPCMVYLTNNLQKHYINSKKLSSKEVLQLMTMNNTYLEKRQFVELLGQEQDKFFTWVKESDPSAIYKAFDQIYSVTYLKYLIEDYLNLLESAHLPNDQLKSSRISLIVRLAKYLNEQTELTQDVLDEIAVYVKKLWEMQPAEFEEEFLKKISPLSFIDNTVRILTGLSARFFSILQPPAPPVNINSDVDKNPKV
ncbi:TPA: Lpg0393 family guanine-nucleotide exchange effector [Legionella pneumophila]